MTGSRIRRHDGRGEHAKLPSQPDIGRHTGPFRCRPYFGDQGHADTKFTAEPDAGNGAVDQEIPVALRQGAHTGEHREQQDGPGQHADAAHAVRQYPKDDTADNGADQGGRDQRSALCRTKPKIRSNKTQHESENQQVKAIHRIAQGGPEQRLVGLAFLRGRKITFQDGAAGSALKLTHGGPPTMISNRRKKNRGRDRGCRSQPNLVRKRRRSQADTKQCREFSPTRSFA